MSGILLLASLFAIRSLLGAGEAVVYPASNCIVASWIPSSERGVANGFVFMGVGFGSAVASPLIAYIMQQFGWRVCFWVSAGLGFLAGAVWYYIARDKSTEHPWVSGSEQKLIEEGISTGSAHAPGSVTLSWSAILRNRNIWAVTFSYFTYGYVAYIFFTWFFIYLSSVRKLNIRASSFYTMLPFLAMAVWSICGGWLSDRLMTAFGERTGRCSLAAGSIAACAAFIGLSTRVQGAELARLVLAGRAGTLYLSQSSFWSISANIGKGSSGSVSALMNMGGQIGGATTASLTPVIANSFG